MITQQSVLYAQQNLLLGKIWTETEKNYSGIRAEQSAIESSEYNEEAVKASAIPQLKLQYQNTYGTLEGSNGGFFPQSGFFNVSGVRNSGASTSSNNFGSAIVEYEIFNFGRQRAEVKAASTFTEKVKTDYLYAKQAFDRLQDAARTKGAVADIELDRAKSIMQSSRSAYEASKAGAGRSSQMNQYLRITAPFSGVIMERNLSAGALVGPNSNMPLFSIAQKNKFRLTVSLPEKHASSIDKAMKATFSVNSIPGKSFEAHLSRNSGVINQENRSITLEFDVENQGSILKGGEYAQVLLNLKRSSPTYFVPSKSILQTQSGTFVMTINNNEVKRIPVKEGITFENMTEVFGMFTPQDKILKKPSEEIEDGKNINLKK
ncbi:efflux RND transporter periplasmic adaptor subunit [Elizabethkingia anophelis]|nr:efflux RND transporter periplasmic adaptor subunit [Elizabethkingia anophelis]